MILSALEAETPSVVVSLPSNSVEHARAAVDAGATAVKVHLNSVHRASGTKFGTLNEERGAIEEILALDIPVGVVPGQDVETVRSLLPDLADLGIDFVDAFAHHMPPETRRKTGLTTWAAPTSDYDREELPALARMDVDALELALFSKNRYGEPLSTREAAQYVDVAHEVSCPVVVPTQLTLKPADAVFLAERGVTNFLLGSIVLDESPESVHEVTRAFVDALDLVT